MPAEKKESKGKGKMACFILARYPNEKLALMASSWTLISTFGKPRLLYKSISYESKPNFEVTRTAGRVTSCILTRSGCNPGRRGLPSRSLEVAY